MAKQKVPLAKPTGSDGEGNIRVTGGPVVLDLGDFDDVFGPMDDSPKEGPLGQFYSGLKSSFKDRFKTKDVVRNFLRSAAPDGISNAMGFANEALNVSQDIRASLEQSNAADLQYIAKRAQALLPKLKDHISEDVFNNINQGLEDKIDEYDYTIQSKRDQTPIRRAAQQQSDDNQIKEALDNIALSDRLNHNRSEIAEQTRHQQNRAEQSIRDLLTTKRFDFMAKSMGMAVDNLQRLTGYNEQVNYGFQRKGLELQFRTFLGIKELVKLNEANLELNARAYNAIVRNTALTDHQKHSTQGLMNIGRETNNNNFLSRTAKALGGKTLSNFLGGYSQDVQGRLTNDLSQKLSLGVMAARMGEGGPSLWDNKYSMAGNFAGEYLADFLLQDIIPTLGREARGPLTKLSDKHGGRHNQLGYFMDNMPAFMQDFVTNGQNQYGWKGKLREMISPYVPTFGLNDRLQNGTFQTIDQPAQFNQANSRSINDAIPGYLARILQEMRMIRTGSDSVGREVFDFTTGKFVAEPEANDNITSRIIPKTAIRGASTTINDAINLMDEDGALTPKARQALAERMLRDASTNKRFDPEAYLRGREYAKGTDPEVADELEQFFRGKFDYTDKGEMVDNSKNHKLRQQYSQAFLDIRSVSRDPINEINRLINSGHTEPLRALGIITVENNVEKINYPRIWEILRSGVTDDNPYAPGGSRNDPMREDRSGIVDHKDFVGPAFPGHEAAWAKNKMIRFRNKYAPEEQAARDQMAKHLRTMRGRFGAAAKSVQAKFDQYGNGQEATDYTSGIKSFSQMMSQAGGAGGFAGPMQGGYQAFIDQKVEANKAAPGYVAKGMEQLTDLYSSFDPTQPLIKGIDFGNGDLIDVNTKKVVTKPSDITGTVINKLGQTVVTATEAAAGLLNPKGDMIVKAIDQTRDVVSKALGLHQNANAQPGDSGTGESSDPNSPEELNSQDWSKAPGEEPVITARGMKLGEYFDDKGKVLSSIADIASDVYDKSGNLLLSARDFANGLWSNRKGTRYRPTKGFSRLLKVIKAGGKYSGRTTSSMIMGTMKFGAKVALGVGVRTFNFFVDNQNAYLPGDPNPVFTRRGVEAGEYYDSKGKVIEDFLDVYEPMVNAQGEPIIPPDQYKNLKNWDGSKHILAKNRKIWGKFVMRPLRFMRDKYISATKRYYKWLGRTTANVGGWIGRKTLGGFAKAGSKLFHSMFEKVEDPNTKAQIDATIMASEQQTAALDAIREAIVDLKPKEKRKGSWQDQADRKAAAAAGANKGDEETEEKRQGFLKRGLAGLASMLGLGKKGKGDDEEEDDEGFGLSDAADIADIKDSIFGGGDDDEKDGKRRKGRKRRRGKGGLISRSVDWIKNSKAGKWVGGGIGKVMQTRAGQAVAGWAGRSAIGRMAVGTVTAALGMGLMAEAGIAVAGVSAMYLYNSIKDSSGEFRRLRLAQYGIKGMRRELKVLKLEALLEKYTDKASDVPSFSLNGAGAKEILEVMGLDIENQEEIQSFAKWLELRFKPVYLAWIGGLNKIGQSKTSINQIDDKVPKELKADLLESVRFPYDGETPYAVLINPFDPDDRPDPNADEIKQMFESLKAEYDPERKKEDAKVDAKGIAKVATTAAATGPVLDKDGKPVPQDSKQFIKELAGQAAAPATIAATAATASSLSGTVNNLNQRMGNTLSALQAIRMRAYGLQVLHLADVRALLSLEAEYAKDLTVSGDSVDYNGDDSKFLAVAGQLLGKNIAVGSADRPKLYNWLQQRFTPTFRAYFATAKGLNPSANLKSLETKLKGADKVTVGAAILGAMYHHDQPVWDCASIFEVKGSLYDLKRLADADMDALRKESEREVVGTPTQKGSDQMAGKNAAEQGGSFADKVVGTIKETWASTKETVSGAWNRSKEAIGDTVDSAKIAMGMGADYGGDGKAAGGTVQSQGTKGNVIQGNGGQWESIPYPSASGSIKAAYPTLKAVAEMTGVPVDWLLVIAGIESGFRYAVKAGTSSAEGWYQFINSTWDSMYAKYGPQFGCPADPGKTRAERKDPRINALMGAMYIKVNYNGLKKALNRDNITDTDVYMAHFLGLGGAIKFFKADPNMMAYKVFKKEYSANMPLFFVNSKPGQPRTIQQLYQLFQQKIEKFWQTTGKGYRTGEAASDVPATPEAQAPGDAKVDENAQTAANLKEDANAKDGVAAEGDKGPEPTKEEAIQQGNPNAQPSVQSMARNTAPMPGAPATGGGSSSSVNNTGTNSGGATVDNNQQAQMDAAQAQNTRRQNELKRDQRVASDVNEIQTQQLNTLFEIRDFMKIQVEQTEQLLNKFGSPQGNTPNAGGSGNNMNPSGIKGRAAADRQSAVTLR